MSRERSKLGYFVSSKDKYLNKIFQTKSSGSCEVVEYTNSTNIVVEFENGYRKRTSVKELSTGWIKNPTKHLMFCVWVNTDAEIKTPLDKELYKRWTFILRRCFYTKHTKSYDDVGICEEWLNFSIFRRDLMKTKGIENLLHGWALDKDLVSLGNRTYCPEFVRAVPREVNNALLTSKSVRSPLALGVCRFGKDKFFVRCNGKSVYNIETLTEAKQIYWEIKKADIENICKKWENEVCSNVISSLKNVKLEDLE